MVDILHMAFSICFIERNCVDFDRSLNEVCFESLVYDTLIMDDDNAERL